MTDTRRIKSRPLQYLKMDTASILVFQHWCAY